MARTGWPCDTDAMTELPDSGHGHPIGKQRGCQECRAAAARIKREQCARRGLGLPGCRCATSDCG